jgi:hypothetical protein
MEIRGMAVDFNFPKALYDAVSQPPFRVQMAFNANWMEADRFNPEEIPPNDALRAVIDSNQGDVAIEFCFKLRDGANFFFGVRCSGDLNAEETLRFVANGLKCGQASGWKSFQEFINRVETAVFLRQNSLCREIDNVEIGIVDYWKRGDVVEIWNAQSPQLPSLVQIESALGGFKSLQKNTIKFVCLESNFMAPLHHWFGVEISSEEGGVHTLDTTMAYARLLENFSQT